MYTLLYSNTSNSVSSQSLSTSETETTAPSPISRVLSDTSSDQSDIEVSTDSLSPLPKQPRIEPTVSAVNIDVA